VELTAADKNELMRPVRVYLRGGDPARNARQDAALRSTFAQGPT
jgi:hypothetical protein